MTGQTCHIRVESEHHRKLWLTINIVALALAMSLALSLSLILSLSCLPSLALTVPLSRSDSHSSLILILAPTLVLFVTCTHLSRAQQCAVRITLSLPLVVHGHKLANGRTPHRRDTTHTQSCPLAPIEQTHRLTLYG